MSIRKIMCACMILGSIVVPALAQADTDIIVTTPPPPVRTEAAPAAREGYIWAPGYWKWENGEHVWVEGHWVEARLHSHWVPDRWEQQDSTHWHFIPGRWETE